MTDRAQDFADRLQQLESDGDVDSFVGDVFATDVELLRPLTGQHLTGQEGARAFWAEYLATFAEVRSTFGRVHDGEVGVLEWTSEARLAGGDEVSYSGVSLLDHDEQGRVTRFSTYYDTSVFQPSTL